LPASYGNNGNNLLILSSTVAPWFMQYRGNFDVLIHPNSGFEREDVNNDIVLGCCASSQAALFSLLVLKLPSSPVLSWADSLSSQHHDWAAWLGTPWFLDLSDPEFAEQVCVWLFSHTDTSLFSVVLFALARSLAFLDVEYFCHFDAEKLVPLTTRLLQLPKWKSDCAC
jgi:hypothetical protein